MSCEQIPHSRHPYTRHNQSQWRQLSDVAIADCPNCLELKSWLDQVEVKVRRNNRSFMSDFDSYNSKWGTNEVVTGLATKTYLSWDIVRIHHAVCGSRRKKCRHPPSIMSRAFFLSLTICSRIALRTHVRQHGGFLNPSIVWPHSAPYVLGHMYMAPVIYWLTFINSSHTKVTACKYTTYF